MKLHLSITAAVLLLGASSSARAQAPGGAGPDEELRDLVRKGIEASRANRLDEAEQHYQAAWDRRPSFDVAANLGDVERRIGQWADAATHLAAALRLMPVAITDEQRRRIDEGLVEARSHVGAVELTVEPAGADIEVDGRRVGTSPLADPLFMVPGEHAIVVSRAGSAPRTIQATARAGEVTKLEVRLEAAGPGSPQPPGTPPSEHASSDPRPIIAVVGYGATALALGVGIGLVAAANGAASDADEALAALTEERGPSPCAGGAPPAECATIADDRSSADGLGTGAVVGLVGAGVLAIGTTVLVLVSAPDESAASAGWRVRPAVGATNGVWFDGRF